MFLIDQYLFIGCDNTLEVRGQWFRDDPAFLLLILLFQAGRHLPRLALLSIFFHLSIVSVIAFTVWLQTHVRGFFLALIWAWLVDCILSGILVATSAWWVWSANPRCCSNRYPLFRLCLKMLTTVLPPAQDIPEWAYCFDIHLNAFFPMALGVYGVQGLFLPREWCVFDVCVCVCVCEWCVFEV